MSARVSCGVLAGLLCWSLCAAPRARADAAPSSAASRAIDQQLSAELSASLSDEASSAFTWRVTWTAINGAVAVASVAGAFILPSSQRPSMIVGAISAGFSTAFTWLLPLEVEVDAEAAAQLASLPEGQRRAQLQTLYVHSAQDESDRIQWQWHAVSVLTALIPAAILWFGYGQLLDGALSLLTGLALGELAILTQPTSLADRLEASSGALQVAVTGRGALLSYTIAW